MPEIYSFDVFDTCITRTYYHPPDLFLELASRMITELPVKDRDNAITLLACQRARAEDKARRGSLREDITIYDIYQQLAEETTFPVELDKMISLELNLELDSIQPIQKTLERYKNIASTGRRIIFISDMYLPKNTVLSMLRKSGYRATSESLYLSGEIGLTKRSGNLYKHIMNQENVTADAITHFGDNLRSDVKMAKSTGIKSIYVSPLKPATQYENILQKKTNLLYKFADKIQKNFRLYRKFYKPPISDFPVDKQIILSRVTAASRLLLSNTRRDGSYEATIHEIGFFVAAPLFNSFVYWLLKRAQDLGIERLYFVARNGQIFHKIAQKICIRKGYSIECRYLYGSRAAWYPSSFEAFDDLFIELLVNKYPNRTIREILEDLSLPIQEIDKTVDFLSRRNCDVEYITAQDDVREFLTHLKKSDYSKAITEHFEKSRQDIVDYLDQEEFFNESKIGIVDIGWHLSSHNALARITNRVNGTGFSGFYFGVGRKHQKVPDTSPFHAYVTDSFAKTNSWLFKLGAMSLLEEVFAAADHSTTSGYFRDGVKVVPRLKERPIISESLSARIVQEDILKFTEFILATKCDEDLELIKNEALEQFERLYKYPKANEAEVMADTSIYALTSHSESQRRTLAHKIELTQLFAIICSVIVSNRDITPKWVWLQGSMAMSNGIVASIGKVLSFLESMILKLKS